MFPESRAFYILCGQVDRIIFTTPPPDFRNTLLFKLYKNICLVLTCMFLPPPLQLFDNYTETLLYISNNIGNYTFNSNDSTIFFAYSMSCVYNTPSINSDSVTNMDTTSCWKWINMLQTRAPSGGVWTRAFLTFINPSSSSRMQIHVELGWDKQ